MTPRSSMLILISALAGSILASPAHASITLTPGDIRYQERIPFLFLGMTDIKFVVKDDDWMERIGMPDMAGRNTSRSVYVSNRSSHRNLELWGPMDTIPGGKSLIIPPGEEIGFHHWHPEGWYANYGSNYRELRLPDYGHRNVWELPSSGRTLITSAIISPMGHAKEIVLPKSPRPFDTVVISNVSNGSTAVVGSNTLFPKANLNISSFEKHMYVYDPYYGKWKLSFAPDREVPLSDAAGPVYFPRTSISLKDGHWMPLVRMPNNWHIEDRNRRIVRSSATLNSEILFNGERLPLRKGDEYEFIRIYEGEPGSGRWELLRHPTQHLKLGDYRVRTIPDALHPLTWITAHPGDSNLRLPQGRQGARLVIDNTALLAHQAVTITAPDLFIRAKAGEQISFRMNNGRWERETSTIDLLFAVEARRGEIGSTDDALNLMRDSLRLANQALDNSGASFRFREAGYLSTAIPTHLDSRGAAQWLQTNTDTQRALRNGQYDGVYYGGTSKSDCSASHHSAAAKELILVTSLWCPSSHFREQAGVALGLPLRGDRASVIGYGNKIPLYPTPHRFLDDGTRANHGQRDWDWVSHMNQVAHQVVKYGESR